MAPPVTPDVDGLISKIDFKKIHFSRERVVALARILIKARSAVVEHPRGENVHMRDHSTAAALIGTKLTLEDIDKNPALLKRIERQYKISRRSAQLVHAATTRYREVLKKHRPDLQDFARDKADEVLPLISEKLNVDKQLLDSLADLWIRTQLSEDRLNMKRPKTPWEKLAPNARALVEMHRFLKSGPKFWDDFCELARAWSLMTKSDFDLDSFRTQVSRWCKQADKAD